MPDAAPNAGSRRNDDAYVVVARRYRPTSFEELIGQDQVSQALRAAITSHRVGHAYLFTGARGVGKTSTARIFGKALNCVEGPTPTPCNRCDVCLSVAAGEDVDVLEIDGASNRGIEEIRQLRSTVGVRPSRGRYKVYIIDEVHMLTTAAFNALLKTLEEPPEHVKFIFCTTDPEKIPITVLSRCQRFDFPPVKTVDIQERLRQIAELEGVEVEPEALGILARRAAGSMRDSQSLLEQLLSFSGKRIGAEDVHRMLGTAGGGRLAALLDAVVARDIPRTLIETDGAVQDGVDAGQLAEQLLQVFRDVLVLTHQGPVDLLSSQLSGEPDRLRAAGERLGAASVMAAMQILDQAVARMRHSLHARVLFEMAVVRLATLADLDAIDRLVRVVARGENPVAALAGGLMPTGLPAPGTSPPVPPSSLGAGGGQRSSPSPAPLAAPSALPSSANPPHPPATSAEPAASADSRSKKNDLTDPEGRSTVGATTGVSGTTEPNGALSTGFGDSPSEAPSGRVPGAAESLAAASRPVNFGASPRSSRPLDASNAETIWVASLDAMTDSTRDFARDFARVAIGGPNTLVVTLRSTYNKEMCERPERRVRLEEAVQAVTGQRVRIDFQTLPTPSRPQQFGSTQAQRRQFLRDVQQHPWIAEAMELFDGEVIDARPPRRAPGS